MPPSSPSRTPAARRERPGEAATSPPAPSARTSDGPANDPPTNGAPASDGSARDTSVSDASISDRIANDPLTDDSATHGSSTDDRATDDKDTDAASRARPDPGPGPADPDPADPDPGIPDDVATGFEELPPGFWDQPPQDGPREPTGGTTQEPARPASSPTPSAAPSPASSPVPSPSPARPRPAASPARPRGRAAGGGKGGGADLQHALLGGDATAEELPAALRDTVEALEELFPGEVLAVSPRGDEPDPDAESELTLGSADDLARDPDPGTDPGTDPGSDADPSGGQHPGPTASGGPDGPDRTTPHRTDAG